MTRLYKTYYATIMAIPFFVGFILTLGFIFVALLSGLSRDRGVYPATLIAIALFYVVFAFEHGSHTTIIFNIIVAALFIGSAIFGYLRGLYVVAYALIGHGIFDVIYHVSGDSPAPDWWAPLCVAADVVLGGFLIYALKTNKLSNR